MDTSANITAAVFAAYLKCPTKAYLTAHGEKPPDTFFADTRGRISAAYKGEAMGLTGVVPIDFLRLAGDPSRTRAHCSWIVRPRPTHGASRRRRG
jgi:hypothetical protein